jgi:tRNA 2-selenouridine synthase
VLHGLTGTGKTAILRRLPNAIDLEGFAGHRSSLFGGMGLEPRTQKMFESLLVARVDELRAAPFVAVEGESRKIGDIHLPSRMLERMRSSPAILVTASMERRVEMLLKEYAPSAGTAEVEAILGVLAPRVGRKTAAALTELYGRGDLGGFAAILLEKYYDPLYGRALEAMEFIARVENSDTAEAARLVREAIERHLAAGNSLDTEKKVEYKVL